MVLICCENALAGAGWGWLALAGAGELGRSDQSAKEFMH